MVLIELNKPKKLLHFSYVGHVTREDLVSRRAELDEMLDELGGSFRLLSDLTRLDFMDRDCTLEIGRVMELCEAKGVETVVRVIPDPKKDIGLNILTQFHYSHKVRTIVSETFAGALKILGL